MSVKRNSASYAMLVELMAVILFFSLSSCAILLLFVGANNRATEAKRLSGAITAATGVAEALRVSSAPEEEFTYAYGASPNGDGLEAPLDASFMPRFDDLPGEYIMRLELSQEGELYNMTVRVLTYGGDEIYSLNCASYTGYGT